MNKPLICNDENRIKFFLEKADSYFFPALSSRVDISIYSRKLSKNAFNVFIHNGEEDIAHAAVYVNDKVDFKAFLSTICVLPNSQGRGYASKLLNLCIEHAKQKGMQFFELEVDNNNKDAILFYKRKEFEISSSVSDQKSMIMRVKIF
jgi:ribosomal protein S18 acetylase RimI-like enzyme